MEKGLYEDAEKNHIDERSRSATPSRFSRPRSPSPVYSRPTTPVRMTSPVKFCEPTFSTYSPERSRSPVTSNGCYDDFAVDLTSDGHEIYPHRRTRSYARKFGSQNDLSSQVDLNDPEIQELLTPKTSGLPYKVGKCDNQFAEETEGLKAKRKLMYSPYMDKDFVPKSKQDNMTDIQKPVGESTPKIIYKPTSQRKSSLQEEWERKQFMEALDSAVKQTPAQIAQERFQKQLDMMSTEEPVVERWRSPTKGILKNAKSAQNMSIKENISPRRSFESRSYSPSVRSSTYMPSKGSRSFTPDSRSYNSPSPLGRSYSTNVAPSRSYSPASKNNRSASPGNTAQRSHSPGSYRGSSVLDSGYSTPSPTNNRIRSDNRDYNRPRTPSTTRHE